MQVPFVDRAHAGQLLANALNGNGGCRDKLVLALPRGGVPVAFEVARRMGAPLDLMLVRKLGAPGREELAMGALTSSGEPVRNPEIITALGISDAQFEAVVASAAETLRRRKEAYRGDRPPPRLAGRCVILVDDGLATGATMRAAVAAVQGQEPSRVVVAVPVAPAQTVERLAAEADDVVCLLTPERFLAVGQWYQSFSQLTDEEVRDLLTQAWELGETPEVGS